jgi:hypothetical protein
MQHCPKRPRVLRSNARRVLRSNTLPPIGVSECGNSVNVKTLFEHQRTDGRWANTFFLIDGDNQGNPYPNDSQFIHLPVYCIENLLIDPTVLALVFGTTPGEAQQELLSLIRAKKGVVFKKNKFFEFLTDALQAEHLTAERLGTFDASVILPDLLSRHGVSVDELASRYFATSRANNLLEAQVPADLLNALISAPMAVTLGNGDVVEGEAEEDCR